MHDLPEPYKTLFEVVSLDCRPEVIPELMRKGANLAYCDPNNGRTPLYAAVRANRIRAVESLLKNGANPNQRFTYRSPVDGGIEAERVALHYAVSPEMVAILLAAGTDVNAIDVIGTTPLMCAAFHGLVPVVEALLAAGANALARQDKQHVRRAPSARDMAEVKARFFEKFIAGRNPDLTRNRLQCYGRIREVLLAAEGGTEAL